MGVCEVQPGQDSSSWLRCAGDPEFRAVYGGGDPDRAFGSSFGNTLPPVNLGQNYLGFMCARYVTRVGVLWERGELNWDVTLQ